jgi:hypothetical protein
MGLKTHELLTFDMKGHYAWLVWCPACDSPHSFDKRWTFNGDHERPTFTASMLIHESPGRARCHSMLTDGAWHYLGDCTHPMANKTVDAPDWSSIRWATMGPDGVVRGE